MTLQTNGGTSQVSEENGIVLHRFDPSLSNGKPGARTDLGRDESPPGLPSNRLHGPRGLHVVNTHSSSQVPRAGERLTFCVIPTLRPCRKRMPATATPKTNDCKRDKDTATGCKKLRRQTMQAVRGSLFTELRSQSPRDQTTF